MTSLKETWLLWVMNTCFTGRKSQDKSWSPSGKPLPRMSYRLRPMFSPCLPFPASASLLLSSWGLSSDFQWMLVRDCFTFRYTTLEKLSYIRGHSQYGKEPYTWRIIHTILNIMKPNRLRLYLPTPMLSLNGAHEMHYTPLSLWSWWTFYFNLASDRNTHMSST